MQEFADSVRKVIDGKIGEIHTAMPGVVMEYDAKTNRATVVPVAQYKIRDGKYLNYPVLFNVPVVFSCCGGGAAIAFPIGIGDDCLIICSENDLVLWESGFNNGAETRFELSNAICIPGLLKEPNDAVVEANEKNAIVIKNGKSKIVVGEDGIEETVNGFAANGKRHSFTMTASEWYPTEGGALYNHYSEWATEGMKIFIAPSKATVTYKIYAEAEDSAISVYADSLPAEDITIDMIVYPAEDE